MWENVAFCWLIAGLVLIIIEVLTPGGFVLLFFGISALIVGAIEYICPMDFWLRGVLFSVMSIVSLMLFRKPLSRWIASPETPDEFVGKVARVTADITPPTSGKVSFNGSDWTATADAPIAAGTPVKICSRDNLTLHVQPAN